MLHDWTLDCRSNGTGVTREHGLAELKSLDIGYGHTADGGKTFPLRGKGIGMMPTLDEVLARFPGKRFLINIKSKMRLKAICWPRGSHRSRRNSGRASRSMAVIGR